MAISAELQARYSTEVDQDWFGGLELSHSYGGTMRLCDAESDQTGAIDGTVYTFSAIPFKFSLPARDAEGRQQASLQICAVGRTAIAMLNAALADPTERIRCRYGQWIRGDTTQQWDPLLELSLTDVQITAALVTATATSADILNRPFPRQVYRVDRYPGLDRR